MERIARFRQPSRLGTDAQTLLLFLAAQASSEAQEPQSPTLFSGVIAHPVLFRDQLLCLETTVRSRFDRLPAFLVDPVITVAAQRLRFEVFTGCSSVYARLDLDGDAFAEAAPMRAGTTNIDFNPALVQHLRRFAPGSEAALEVGEDSVRLSRDGVEAVERKVKLPPRWVKGFLESQAVQRGCRPVFELGPLAARQLLTRLPAKPGRRVFVVPQGKGTTLLDRAPSHKTYAQVRDARRLRLLLGMVPHLRKLRVYAAEDTGASLWVADTHQGRITLLLTPSGFGGLSGDGASLRTTDGTDPDLLDLVLTRLAAAQFEEIDVAALAARERMPTVEVQAVLDHLSRQGLLGYDRVADRFFYRALPFAPERFPVHNRLRGARRLKARVTLQRVQRDSRGLAAEGIVEGDRGDYRVGLLVDPNGRLASGSCTCPWHRHHGLARGPCKHLLALRFQAENAP